MKISITDILLIILICLAAFIYFDLRNTETKVETKIQKIETPTVKDNSIGKPKKTNVTRPLTYPVTRLPNVENKLVYEGDAITVDVPEMMYDDSTQVGEAVVYYKHFLTGKFSRPSEYRVTYPEKTTTVTKTRYPFIAIYGTGGVSVEGNVTYGAEAVFKNWKLGINKEKGREGLNCEIGVKLISF